MVVIAEEVALAGGILVEIDDRIVEHQLDVGVGISTVPTFIFL